MNLASAIEGGITGATTLSLIQEALHKIDPKAPRPLLHQSGAIKKLKKKSGKKGSHSGKFYIKLAGELLATASYFGLSGLGKKKNVVLRGSLLGAMAGLGAAFFNEDSDEATKAKDGERTAYAEREDMRKKVLTVALYTAGGMLSGIAIKKFRKKTFKKLVRGKGKKK
jgi:hypothetical protein